MLMFLNDESFTPEVFLKWLAAHNIEVKQITLIRYAKQGYMMEQRWRTKLDGVGRVYYSKLAPIEFITASLLTKGCLDIDGSTGCIVKFNGMDIFLSRLVFYARNFDMILARAEIAKSDLLEFSTAVPDAVGEVFHLSMDKESIDNYLIDALPRAMQKYGFENTRDFDRYVDCLTMIYSIVYIKVLDMYGKDLL